MSPMKKTPKEDMDEQKVRIKSSVSIGDSGLWKVPFTLPLANQAGNAKLLRTERGEKDSSAGKKCSLTFLSESFKRPSDRMGMS